MTVSAGGLSTIISMTRRPARPEALSRTGEGPAAARVLERAWRRASPTRSGSSATSRGQSSASSSRTGVGSTPDRSR